MTGPRAGPRAVIAVIGAAKILKREIDAKAHADVLGELWRVQDNDRREMGGFGHDAFRSARSPDGNSAAAEKIALTLCGSIIEARAAGATEDQQRAIVAELHAARKRLLAR